MIRSVAYAKAVFAGMAGAIVWEIVARLLIWAGVPFFDIVGTLGNLALPHADPWASWAMGMLLHLLVGAIWAVFYAYFFWSTLELPPTLQGLAFAAGPAVLAGFLLAFTLSLDNTIVAAFVQVSGTTPWPVYVLSAVRSGLRPEIAAVSTVMLLLTLVALALVALVLKRAGDSATQIARTMTGG